MNLHSAIPVLTVMNFHHVLLEQKLHDRALLASVDAALKRINEGTFGNCLNCGQEINPKRLEALPWVRFCITCQELIDGSG